MNIDNNLQHLLENETKIHLAEIRFLYQKLDRQLGLNGARVPITFGFDTDRLGAYTPGFGQGEGQRGRAAVRRHAGKPYHSSRKRAARL